MNFSWKANNLKRKWNKELKAQSLLSASQKEEIFILKGDETLNLMDGKRSKKRQLGLICPYTWIDPETG